MGVKGTRNEVKPIIKLTESTIQESLKNILSQPRFLLKNLYVFGWESDLLILTKSGYWYEYEIKISRADFKNDFKHKADKHIKYLQNIEYTRKPNYFYYAVPENMISIDEVPEYAGLIYVTEYGSNKIVKQAPKLHKEKVDPNTLSLVDKFYYNMVNAKIDAKNSKYSYQRLEDKYSNMTEVEDRNKSIGFERCLILASRAYTSTCTNYIKGDDSTYNSSCSKYPNSRSGFSFVRCNCDEIKRFEDTILDLKENGYQN